MTPPLIDPNWTRKPRVFADLTALLRRHVLLLHVGYRSGATACQKLYSGFLFRTESDLFWVTAAHCIEQVKEIASTPGCELISTRFYDALDKSPHPGIRFPLLENVVWHPSSDDVDVAVVRITGNWRQLLEANPLYYPLDREATRGCETVQADVLCMLGLPTDWIQEERSEAETFTALTFHGNYACVPIEIHRSRRGKNDDADFWKRHHCLFRRVRIGPGWPARTLDSILGMSGGPVFALRATPEGLRYWLVGVQSSWLKNRRVVCIEPTRSIVGLIQTLVDLGGFEGVSESGATPSGSGARD